MDARVLHRDVVHFDPAGLVVVLVRFHLTIPINFLAFSSIYLRHNVVVEATADEMLPGFVLVGQLILGSVRQ